MSDTTDREEQGAGASDDNIIEFQGRTFNVSTPEGRAAHRAFLDGLSHVLGKVANENGQLKKAVAPFKKLGLNAETMDEASLAKRVAKLKEDGNVEEAIGLMFSELQTFRQKTEQEKAEDAFWKNYAANRREVVDALDEEIARTYVFSNYRDQLYEAEDPYQLVDSILMPKAAKRIKAPEQKKEQEPVVSASLGAGKGGSRPAPKGRPDAEDEADKKARERMEAMITGRRK